MRKGRCRVLARHSLEVAPSDRRGVYSGAPPDEHLGLII
jgi:hypothetical protein